MQEAQKLWDMLILEEFPSRDAESFDEVFLEFIEKVKQLPEKENLSTVLKEFASNAKLIEEYQRNPNKIDLLISELIRKYQDPDHYAMIDYLKEIYKQAVGKELNIETILKNYEDFKFTDNVILAIENLNPGNRESIDLALVSIKDAVNKRNAGKMLQDGEAWKGLQRVAMNYTDLMALKFMEKINNNARLTSIEKAQQIDAFMICYCYLKNDVQGSGVGQNVINRHTELSAQYRNQIAGELRAVSESLLANANVDELQRDILENSKKAETSNQAEIFNLNRGLIIEGVLQSVLSQGDNNASTLAVRRWVEIAMQAHNTHDLFTAEAIVKALKSDELKKYVTVIKNEKKSHAEAFDLLEKLYSSDKNIHALENTANKAADVIPVMTQKFSEMTMIYSLHTPKADEVDKRPIMLEPYFKELRDKQSKYNSVAVQDVTELFGKVLNITVSENRPSDYRTVLSVNLLGEPRQQKAMDESLVHLNSDANRVGRYREPGIKSVGDRPAQEYNDYLAAHEGVSSNYYEDKGKEALLNARVEALVNQIAQAIIALPDTSEDRKQLKERLLNNSNDLGDFTGFEKVFGQMMTDINSYASFGGLQSVQSAKIISALLSELHILYDESNENRPISDNKLIQGLEKIKNENLRFVLIDVFEKGRFSSDDLPTENQIKEFVFLLNDKERALARHLNYEEYKELLNDYRDELRDPEAFFRMGNIFSLSSNLPLFYTPESMKTENSTENSSKSRKRPFDVISKPVKQIKKMVSNKRMRLAVDLRDMSEDAKKVADKSIAEIALAIIENPAIADDFMKKMTDKNLKSGLARNYRQEFAKAYTYVRDMIIEGDARVLNAILANNLLNTRHLDPTSKYILEKNLESRLREKPELIQEIIDCGSRAAWSAIEESQLLQKIGASKEFIHNFRVMRAGDDYKSESGDSVGDEVGTHSGTDTASDVDEEDKTLEIDTLEINAQEMETQILETDISAQQKQEKRAAEDIANAVNKKPDLAPIIFKNKENKRMLIENPESLEKIIRQAGHEVLDALVESGVMLGAKRELIVLLNTKINALREIANIENAVLRSELTANLKDSSKAVVYERYPNIDEIKTFVNRINIQLDSENGLNRTQYLRIVNDCFEKPPFVSMLDVSADKFSRKGLKIDAVSPAPADEADENKSLSQPSKATRLQIGGHRRSQG